MPWKTSTTLCTPHVPLRVCTWQRHLRSRYTIQEQYCSMRGRRCSLTPGILLGCDHASNTILIFVLAYALTLGRRQCEENTCTPPPSAFSSHLQIKRHAQVHETVACPCGSLRTAHRPRCTVNTTPILGTSRDMEHKSNP